MMTNPRTAFNMPNELALIRIVAPDRPGSERSRGNCKAPRLAVSPNSDDAARSGPDWPCP